MAIYVLRTFGGPMPLPSARTTPSPNMLTYARRGDIIVNERKGDIALYERKGDITIYERKGD